MPSTRSLLLGHRGLSSKHLENSLEAFRAALAAGMDGFELDVQPTRDGVCLVLHDEDLSRTANGSGLLRQMKAAELPPLKNGEALPRLADVLELPAKLINVELKGEPGWQQALATVEAAEALDLTAEELADLPGALWFHPPLKAVKARPELWAPYADRLALWGMKTAAEARDLPFIPAVLITDGL